MSPPEPSPAPELLRILFVARIKVDKVFRVATEPTIPVGLPHAARDPDCCHARRPLPRGGQGGTCQWKDRPPHADGLPTRTSWRRIFRSLDDYAEATGRGVALPDNVGFATPELASGRQSFSPDAAYYLGLLPSNPMRFLDGPPTFAVEVRSENDYGDVGRGGDGRQAGRLLRGGDPGCMGRRSRQRACPEVSEGFPGASPSFSSGASRPMPNPPFRAGVWRSIESSPDLARRRTWPVGASTPWIAKDKFAARVTVLTLARFRETTTRCLLSKRAVGC